MRGKRAWREQQTCVNDRNIRVPHGQGARSRSVDSSVVKILRSKSTWLIIAATYTVVSLQYFGSRLPVSPTAPVTIKLDPASKVDVDLDRTMTYARASEGGKLFTFAIPTSRRVLDDARGFGFSIIPSRTVTDCTVQVIASCDHHCRYAHDYVLSSLDVTGMRGFAPFRGMNGYWKPAGHDGMWSAWNVVGLRALEVKIFSKKKISAKLKLSYGWHSGDPDERITLAWTQPLADPIALGERFELAFDLDGWKGNPFDPDDMLVTLEVIPPQ